MIAYEIQLRYEIRDKIQSEKKMIFSDKNFSRRLFQNEAKKYGG